MTIQLIGLKTKDFDSWSASHLLFTLFRSKLLHVGFAWMSCIPLGLNEKKMLGLKSIAHNINDD